MFTSNLYQPGQVQLSEIEHHLTSIRYWMSGSPQGHDPRLLSATDHIPGSQKHCIKFHILCISGYHIMYS